MTTVLTLFFFFMSFVMVKMEKIAINNRLSGDVFVSVYGVRRWRGHVCVSRTITKTARDQYSRRAHRIKMCSEPVSTLL